MRAATTRNSRSNDPAVGQPREGIGQSILNCATQLPTQLSHLRRAAAELRLEAANPRP